MASPLPDLDSLAKEGGSDTDVLLYLKDRGVATAGALFHLSSDIAQIGKLLEPLVRGVTLSNTKECKKDDTDILIVTASLQHMVDLFTLARNQALGGATSATNRPPAVAASAGADSASSKVPKTLPEGYWADFVSDFNKQILGGRNREFPVHLLVGAEETLARMIHEQKSSKLFTPVKLGEILSSRHFTASGQISAMSLSPSCLQTRMGHGPKCRSRSQSHSACRPCWMRWMQCDGR